MIENIIQIVNMTDIQPMNMLKKLFSKIQLEII